MVGVLALRTVQLRHTKVRLEALVEARTSALEATNLELLKTISEVKTIRGLIPICSVCKKIRVAPGAWEQLEAYFTEKTEAKFSHGYCPECAELARADYQKSLKQ
jgi:hypothetical protein